MRPPEPTIAQQLLGIAAEYVHYHFPTREARRVGMGKPHLDRAVARENLLIMHEAFGRHEVPFFLMYGTLLGAIREGDFIAHDHDIELGTFQENRAGIVEALRELRSRDFEIIRTNHPDDVVTLIRKDEIIDMGIFARQTDPEGVEYRVYQNNREYHLHPQRLDTINFLDRQFSIPKEPEGYLERWYGPDWRVPKEDMPAWPHDYPGWKKLIHTRAPALVSLFQRLSGRP